MVPRERSDRLWFWFAFAVSFVLMGIVTPAAIALSLVGWAFAFGAGPSPFWILLAYPVLIVGSWVATKTSPERPGPRGTLLGTVWGLFALVFVVASFVLLAPHTRKAIPRSSGPLLATVLASHTA